MEFYTGKLTLGRVVKLPRTDKPEAYLDTSVPWAVPVHGADITSVFCC